MIRIRLGAISPTSTHMFQCILSLAVRALGGKWHSDLGGMQRVTSELEKLGLIDQGYSFCREKMVRAVMAQTAPAIEIDPEYFFYRQSL